MYIYLYMYTIGTDLKLKKVQIPANVNNKKFCEKSIDKNDKKIL